MDLHAVGARELGDQEPHRPGAEHQARDRPADSAAARTERSALPPGSTIAPAVSSTLSGNASSAVAGTASCSASAPGKPPRMPISTRFSQTL